MAVIANLIIFQSQINLVYIDDAFFIYSFIHNINMNLTLTICFMLLLAWSVVEELYVSAHNKFDRLCIQRIGYKKYYQRSIIEIIKKVVVFKVVYEILLVLSILFIWKHDLNFIYNPLMAPTVIAFHQDLTLNLLAYLVCSTIGTIVFCILLFSTIDFIKNLYVFRVLAPLVALVGFVASIVISPFIYNFLIPFISNDRLLRTLISFYIPINLLEPGSLWSSLGYLNLLTTVLFFGVVIYFLMKKTYKKRELYG